MFSAHQVLGPFRSWEHTHRFDDEGSQTRLADIIRYSLPFGMLGRLGEG